MWGMKGCTARGAFTFLQGWRTSRHSPRVQSVVVQDLLFLFGELLEQMAGAALGGGVEEEGLEKGGDLGVLLLELFVEGTDLG